MEEFVPDSESGVNDRPIKPPRSASAEITFVVRNDASFASYSLELRPASRQKLIDLLAEAGVPLEHRAGGNAVVTFEDHPQARQFLGEAKSITEEMAAKDRELAIKERELVVAIQEQIRLDEELILIEKRIADSRERLARSEAEQSELLIELAQSERTLWHHFVSRTIGMAATAVAGMIGNAVALMGVSILAARSDWSVLSLGAAYAVITASALPLLMIAYHWERERPTVRGLRSFIDTFLFAFGTAVLGWLILPVVVVLLAIRGRATRIREGFRTFHDWFWMEVRSPTAS